MKFVFVEHINEVLKEALAAPAKSSAVKNGAGSLPKSKTAKKSEKVVRKSVTR